MATLRNRARAAAVAGLLAGVAGPGCYKPNIADGGLRCADGGVCPEGYRCASDGRCRKGPPMACHPTMAHVEPLCTSLPGADCDPICQTRCDCGRCNLVGTSLMCVSPGTKKRGERCNAGNDDCAPGNICLNDCGGTQIARCYRFCGSGQNTNDSLCEGNLCDITLNDPNGNPTDHVICEPPLEACNPVVDSNDCADPALGCYVGPTGAPVCDCRGAATAGGACGPYNSCVPGFRCVSLGGPATCFRACRLNSTDCAPASTCATLPGEDTFGFCPS